MTAAFARIGGALHVEGVSLGTIADAVGTPCYVYSARHLRERFLALDAAFGARDHLVCYAVKANGNLSLLSLLAGLGAGFDIVSGGELARVLRAGGRADRVVFSGVGKSSGEIRAALQAGILSFNVESRAELHRIARIAAEERMQAPVSLRVNPDVDPGTHPYIATGLSGAKFGIPSNEALATFREARSMPSIRIAGIDCHIGSQLLDLAPLQEAADRLGGLIRTLGLEGIHFEHVDLGGGLGIGYGDEEGAVPEPAAYVGALLAGLGDAAGAARVLIEPGRAIVGNAGVLLARVEYLKDNGSRRFAIVDAAMNDLIRPALYEAHHAIEPVVERSGVSARYDIVGPVCETGDFLGLDRPLVLEEGDLIAVRSAGAYGFSMSSNYNARPRAAEVLVDGDRFRVVRRRETMEDLLGPEV